MNNTIALILCAAAGIFAAYARWRDLQTSFDAVYYAAKEANAIFRGKYGYIDPVKYIVFSVCVIAAGFAGTLWINPWFGVVSNGLFGAYTLLAVVRSNEKLAIHSRAHQIDLLRQIRLQGSVPSTITMTSYYLGTLDERHFYRAFAWIYSKGPIARARLELDARILDLVTKPESEWFPG